MLKINFKKLKKKYFNIFLIKKYYNLKQLSLLDGQTTHHLLLFIYKNRKSNP
jgi:hypothetical protein